MAKEALILKILLDAIPRTISELATLADMSDTHAFNLCTSMARSGAINLRKSGGTWIAWRAGKNQACEAIGVNEAANE
ncbi:MAG TPA: hypothetical protein VKM55_17565 [Candidatus Lokiarchaeia archaeon]|nr:hypothetical protein [Candidatus Lokiarchaeia archaeon]